MGHRAHALAACLAVFQASGAAVAAGQPGPLPGRWAIEGTVGVGGAARGEYQARLRDFGFRSAEPGLFRYGIGVVHAVLPNLQLVADFGSLDSGKFVRDLLADGPRMTDSFSWSAHAGGVHARFLARFQEGRLNLYLQGGVGAAFGRTRFTQRIAGDGQATPDTRSFTDRAWARQWVWSNGIQWITRHGNGVFLEFRAITATLFQNPLYDRHQSGGPRLLLGGRWAP
jgi:hypothetical protein